MIKRYLAEWSSGDNELIMIENGLIAYTWTGKDKIHLGPMFVHPDHRREGIGTRLVQMCVEVPDVKEATATSMTYRDDVNRLMRKANFVEISRDKKEVHWHWVNRP